MKRFASIICAIALCSCCTGIASLYTSDYPLTSEKAYSKSINLYLNIPNGWFAAEDNECNCTDLWIVNSDYSASISFRKLNFDESTQKEIIEIQKAAYYSKIFVQAKFSKELKDFSGEETFQFGERTFSAYEYKNDKGQSIRVVVFKHYDKFIESEAVSDGYKDLNELFRIQNSLLSTLN